MDINIEVDSVNHLFMFKKKVLKTTTINLRFFEIIKTDEYY